MKAKNKYPVDRENEGSVIIGALVGIDEKNQPIIVYPDNPIESGVVAKSTTLFTSDDVGCDVAMLFENGDKSKPLIIGKIQQPKTEPKKNSLLDIKLDDQEITLSASKQITLSCGKSSITLTKAGKILIRGEYVLTRSSGVNRIKGGSVQIN
ncbi:DUF6484 domain-containing protein [uncultured Cocleimonas sp.]|uniref:DUF6484 domain-containing protein n=1 Tax=uncultured Cocleimonas sp. TaxID=1051587 RepID=UPI0026221654|nr:DUF6484 domain-containing protein [uncultured Cocleimonas sp.]